MATARKARTTKAAAGTAPTVTDAAAMPATAEPEPVVAAAPPMEQAAASYEPPPYVPSTTNGASRAPSGGLFSRMDTGEMTAAERDRQAAMDWERAIAPVMDLMRESVPDASTPEEAERILAQNQGEITPDPKGGSYVQGDAYERDARVYYRLLHRDYEKVPRPSEVGKRPTSHHLHQVYGKLTGNKGW